MPLLRRALLMAAQRLAADPRVQQKAVEVLETKVVPRAQAAWREVEPRVQSVRNDLRDAAQTVNIRKDPVGFATEAANRLRGRRPPKD